VRSRTVEETLPDLAGHPLGTGTAVGSTSRT
jgi:hypothetical protein